MVLLYLKQDPRSTSRKLFVTVLTDHDMASPIIHRADIHLGPGSGKELALEAGELGVPANYKVREDPQKVVL